MIVPQQTALLQRSMRTSFLIGLFLLLLKFGAYWATNSTAILSDLAESIIHVFAVGFATYSMSLSLKPADTNHLYGHDKITFFSAGFEGAMIIIASFAILYTAIHEFVTGPVLENLDAGLLVTGIVTAINGWLGLWLVKRGTRFHSLILEANGKHILTDCVTSIAVFAGIGAVIITKQSWIDPLIACLAALNILKTGFHLIKRSIIGLMDQVDLKFDAKLRDELTELTQKNSLSFHSLRHRYTGAKILVEYHLLFPGNPPLKEAHRLATKIENQLCQACPSPIEITSHLEPISESFHH